jgi:hypothetical protein
MATTLMLSLAGCEQPSKDSCATPIAASASDSDRAVATRQRWSCIEGLIASAAMARGQYDQLPAIHDFVRKSAAEAICRRYESTIGIDDRYERCFRGWSY